MNKTSLSIILLFLSIFFSCNTNNRKFNLQLHPPTIINLSETPKTNQLLSTVADSIKYISLETNDSCIIGTINQIIECKDRFIILDTENSHSVFCFDKNGKFLNKIGNYGEGPGEYKKPENISYDFTSNSVYVNDIGNRKLITYSLKGNFKYEIKIDYYGRNLISLNHNKYAFYTEYSDFNTNPNKNEGYNIFILNKKLQIEQKLLPYSRKLNIENMVFLYNSFSFFNNDSLSFIMPYDNNIYHINYEGYSTFCKINFGKYNLPAAFMDEILKSNYGNSEFTINYIKKGNYSYIKQIVENSKWLFITYLKNNKYVGTFYSKTENIYYESYLPFINDIDNGNPFYGLISTNNNHFIGITYPYILNKIKIDNVKGNLNNIISNLEETDNPVIIIYFMK